MTTATKQSIKTNLVPNGYILGNNFTQADLSKIMEVIKRDS